LALTAYTFANPVLGGQASVGLLTAYGRTSTSLTASLSGALRPRSERFHSGVPITLTYVFGDVPVGAYDSARLANIGVGHAAFDAGGGYTYFNPQTGHEISEVLGFTYNFVNPSTQYQNGVVHFDWGASQFLTKQDWSCRLRL
jgi:hypothetical protein